MKMCGLDLSEVMQLVGGRAETLTQINVLLNHYTVLHDLQKV